MDTNEVIQTLKNLHPNSYVTHGRYQKETYGDSYYVVVNESDGLYFYVKRHSKIDLLHHLSWMDVPEELYLRSRKKDNTYQGASKVIFTIFIGNPDGESIVALLEQKRKIHQLRKSLFRKIPGYRSKKIWKMAVASLFYLFALFIIFIALATDDIDNKNENKKSIAQSVSSEKIKKNTLSSDEETAKKKRAQEKAQAEADKKKKIAQEKAQAEANRTERKLLKL
ncbi:hypothetical protein [Exiguobacterium sp. 9-2]|uniref:hypothetical protein n=1 Tax=Exiguobacterium sp. 9-2 TaxID=3112419 RepID=UPI002E328BDA|nr:hypothetical protein [Exiguobacterium sp. 9-2]